MKMGNNTKNPITIDGVQYFFEDLTQEQQALFSHVVDLDKKIASARFNAEQMQVGRDSFFSMLKSKLEVTDVEAK
jgi:hypothetical protein